MCHTWAPFRRVASHLRAGDKGVRAARLPHPLGLCYKTSAVADCSSLSSSPRRCSALTLMSSLGLKQTSGVVLSDEARICLETMKLHHSKDDPQERIKIVFFKVCTGEIIVDSRVLVKDVGDQDAFEMLQDRLKQYSACYAVYDCHYETKETEKTELVSIMWAPDTSTVKERMMYSSSKDSLKSILAACGIKHDWQVNDLDDIMDKDCFLNKIGKGILKLEKRDVAQGAKKGN
ncbi:Cofilin-2 [Merluccius polli]|uniref:Cofilin-2 n=1 Tax=Merluccius polli TaxID=89951 RepID=A0AA47P8T3_MERPO|nr:Cofilin-2 [Merluccius polli]